MNLINGDCRKADYICETSGADMREKYQRRESNSQARYSKYRRYTKVPFTLA